MTQLGQTMNDLSKGALPVLVVFGMLASVASAAYWVGGRTQTTELTSASLLAQFTRLETQVSSLSLQVQSISTALAKGTPLPEGVALRADLLKFCIENRQLKCPAF